MLRILPLFALLASTHLASLSPQFPPEGRPSLDKFLLVKPYTRQINKYRTLGSVLTTMSEIRLTNDAKSMMGAVWAKEPLGLDAFTVEARLRISSHSSLAADGMGIWFAEKASLGNAYGISPAFTGFGVVLDIYDNTNFHRTPFIGLVASNGSRPLNDHNNGADHMLDSCKLYESGALIRKAAEHNAPESIAVHIEYAPDTIDIFYKMERDLDWQLCLYYKNIYIPKHFFLGVSASTGDLTAQQDLLALKVFEVPLDEEAPKPRNVMHFEQEKEADNAANTTTNSAGSKVFTILFFAFAFFVVVGGLIIIIKPELLPGTQASIDRKKRFY